MLSLGGSVHCSGSVAASHATGDDSGTGALRTGDAGASVGSSTDDAGDQASCQDLMNDAATQFEALVQEHLACTSDDDCTRIFTQGGQCAAACGHVLVDEAGASSMVAAANDLCAPFVAAGCHLPYLGCPAFATLNICAAGTCEGWDPSLKSSATTFGNGVCAPFEIGFVTGVSTATPAPHDLVFALTPENGTLYADSACTTPLTGGSVTLPAGSSSVAFGFVPLAPGQSGFSGNGPDGAMVGMYFSAQ